jgi:nitroreductase
LVLVIWSSFITMDLFEAIQGRKSIRRFKETPVPDGDIRKILNAGRLAPSANNTQPWSFVVIKDRALLRKMAAAARDMIDAMVPFAESEKQAQRLAAYKNSYYTFFENAPVVIAVCMEAYDAGTDGLLAKMGYSPEDMKRLRPLPGLQSVSAAIQNMLLAIHALGYGAVWTGCYPMQDRVSAIQKLFSIPSDVIPLAIIVLGKPMEKKAPEDRFKQERVHREKW